jgi:phosphatidylinositol kinase/protein kinase (PI-3  family)
MRIRDRSDCLYFFDRSNRHNGNILLHGDGRLVHIDFGFFISTSPGGLNWESAPFKLTRDYTEVLGPREGGAFSIFRSALVKAFLAARQNIEAIMQVVDTAFAGDWRWLTLIDVDWTDCSKNRSDSRSDAKFGMFQGGGFGDWGDAAEVGKMTRFSPFYALPWTSLWPDVDRFFPALDAEECVARVGALIEESIDNSRTTSYDKFQKLTNGIM